MKKRYAVLAVCGCLAAAVVFVAYTAMAADRPVNMQGARTAGPREALPTPPVHMYVPITARETVERGEKIAAPRPVTNVTSAISVLPGEPVQHGHKVQGDNCSDPFIIGSIPFTDSQNTAGFTNDYDEVCPYTGSTAPDVVYEYACTQDEYVTIDLCESGYDTKVYVYDNICPDTGSPLACNDDACNDSLGNPYRSKLVCLPFQAGHTYYIVVDGYGTASGTYALDISICQPFEDPCLEGNVIYNNGSFDGVNGLSAERRLDGTLARWVVDDMTFTADSIIEDVHWYTADDPGFDFNGTDDLIILLPDGAGGTPGTVYYQQLDVPNTRVDTGYVLFGRPVYCYTITGLSIPAPAGQYWLGVRPVQGVTGGQSFWLTCPGVGQQVYLDYPDLGYPAWTPGSTVFGANYSVAFCITGQITGQQTGACCAPDGTCTLETETDCLALGYQYLGDGVLCFPNPCPNAPGACCMPDSSCLFISEADCIAMGGTWLGVDIPCDPNPCPPPNDDCDDGILVCYDSTTTGYNTQATNDICAPPCSGYSVLSGVWYEVIGTGHYFTADTFGSDFDTILFVYCGTCDGLTCVGVNDDTGGLQSQVTWCTAPLQRYFIAVGGYGGAQGNIVLTLSGGAICPESEYPDCTPCNVVCPPDAEDEGEPCGADTNGGCNTDPDNPPLTSIKCGDVFCGIGWAEGGTRDTDWYELILTQDTVVTMNMEAEFGVVYGFIEETVVGDPTCYNITGYISPYLVSGPCEKTSLAAFLPAGRHWLFVGPSAYDGYSCTCQDWQYVLELECQLEITGACCDPVTYACTPDLSEADCDAMGGLWLPLTPCDPNPCPQPGDSCALPLNVTLPADLPYSDLGQTTCGRGYNYADTCLGSYDGGEDIIYEITVTSAVDVDIVMDPLGTTWTGMALDDVCPPDATCIAMSTGSTGIRTIPCVHLEPGVYYLMIDTWPTPYCIPSFNLTITVCQPPVGRCCYEPYPNCVDNITQGDCTALYGGTWTVNLNCIDNPCPPPITNDDCADAIAIGDVVDLPFDTTNATFDGPGTCQTTGNLWYCYTASCTGNATVSLCGSSFDTKLAIYDGCTCDPVGAQLCCNDDFCGLQSQCTVAVVEGGQYLIEVGGYSSNVGPGILNVSCALPPVVECPPDSELESEACGDDTNGGCNFDPVNPPTEPLKCGDTFCGTCWSDTGTRDTDWYEVIVTEYTEFTWACKAEFGVVIGLVELTTPGSGDCADSTGYLSPYAVGAALDDISITVCLPPGTHWFFVAPYPFVDLPCGTTNDYVASLDCVPCGATYCAASGGCDEYISQVDVGTISNASGCDQYADYTALSTDMAIGTGYDITVTNGNPYSSDYGYVWVDWNQDLDFDDPGEQVTMGTNPGMGPYTGTITPPADAATGPTRMRVRIAYSTPPGPCGTTTYGEVEDYTINVTSKAFHSRPTTAARIGG
jgi:hypothetical protein